MIGRLGIVGDSAAVARIYSEGIAERIATFETEPRTAEMVAEWFSRKQPTVVVEEGGTVIAFATSGPSSGRCCYASNADFSVYVAREARGRGAGRLAMETLVAEARARGFTKLSSGVFPENVASRALLARVGFREIGTQEKHGKLDGVWRDVILVERLL